jgi:NADH dehydrogenase
MINSKIVVVGGGFGGLWAALAAKRVAGEQASVSMISREPVLQMRPRLYEAAPETLGVDLLPLLQRARISFLGREAVGIVMKEAAIELSSGDRFGYDRLVVATGSKLRRPEIPGADAAFSIDTQAEAVAFDHRLAEIARDIPDPRIAIIGAGFTGIELALEMRDRLAVHGNAILADRLRILLIDHAQEVGAELGPGPRPTIENALSAARVELRLGARVTGISSDRITFDDRSSDHVQAVVLTTGMIAAPFAVHVPGARDPLGRIIVDKFLRAQAAPNIFVTGDAAAADAGDGHRALQSCQHALQLGRFAGENAARDLLGLPLLPYAQRRYVTCLDLGRSGAVLTEGWNREVRRVGPEAKAIKRRINGEVIYPPSDAPAETLLALSSIEPSEQAVRPGRRH